jgi:hypothetical protein
MVKINEKQTQLVAELLKKLPENGKGLNFYSYAKDGKEIIDSEKFPPLHHPQAINFFFFVVMHDYGFYYGDDKGYLEPLYGIFHGIKTKGSDLLWKMCRLALANHEGFDPKYLANITVKELGRIFSDDNGPVIWPDFETRFRMTRAFGRWFIKRGITAEEIVANANSKKESLFYFLSVLRKIPGYDSDPLEKKNLLLAMALANRPEKFLKVNDPEQWMPLVDYHLMRLSLRLGMIEIHDREALRKNCNREWVDFDIERRIRYATYNAVNDLIVKSGRQMSFIDEKIWMARQYCPEMKKPDCSKCIFESICKKRVELFQPIFRTTNY